MAVNTSLRKQAKKQPCRREQFFTQLDTDASIQSAHNRIPEGNLGLESREIHIDKIRE